MATSTQSHCFAQWRPCFHAPSLSNCLRAAAIWLVLNSAELRVPQQHSKCWCQSGEQAYDKKRLKSHITVRYVKIPWAMMGWRSHHIIHDVSIVLTRGVYGHDTMSLHCSINPRFSCDIGHKRVNVVENTTAILMGHISGNNWPAKFSACRYNKMKSREHPSSQRKFRGLDLHHWHRLMVLIDVPGCVHLQVHMIVFMQVNLDKKF